MRKHRVLMQGLDIVTFASDGLIARVDGFFGEQPTPVVTTGSGIPDELRLKT